MGYHRKREREALPEKRLKNKTKDFTKESVSKPLLEFAHIVKLACAANLFKTSAGQVIHY